MSCWLVSASQSGANGRPLDMAIHHMLTCTPNFSCFAKAAGSSDPLAVTIAATGGTSLRLL